MQRSEHPQRGTGVNDREVYEKVNSSLVRYATVLVGPNDAADVVSTVVVRAIGRKGGLAGLDDAEVYLMKAVLNESNSFKRQRARRATLPVADVPEIRAHRDEIDDSIELINGLPPKQRAAAYLVYHEGYQPSEAAALMGVRPGTVRRYLHIARAKLEEGLRG